jgi:hypothetical protein
MNIKHKWLHAVVMYITRKAKDKNSWISKRMMQQEEKDRDKIKE